MRATRVAGAVYLIGFCVFLALPVYWALLTTLDTGGPVGWRSFLPLDITLDGWRFLGSGDNWVSMRNSALVATATALASVALGLPAAYAIARLRRGGVVVLAVLVAVRLIPPVAVILPAFLLAHRYHLRDTLVGLVVFYTPLTLTFTVLLGVAWFRRTPAEIEEAALVDGCSRFGAVRHVVVPLALPTIVAAGLLAFAFAWTELFVAFVFFRREALTLPLHVAYNASYACYGCVPPAPPLQLSLLGLVPSIVCGLVLFRYLGRRAARW